MNSLNDGILGDENYETFNFNAQVVVHTDKGKKTVKIIVGEATDFAVKTVFNMDKKS